MPPGEVKIVQQPNQEGTVGTNRLSNQGSRLLPGNEMKHIFDKQK